MKGKKSEYIYLLNILKCNVNGTIIQEVSVLIVKVHRVVI